MNYYSCKLIFQLTTGMGLHTEQFDEQQVLLLSSDKISAFNKAKKHAYDKEFQFKNGESEWVRWTFLGVIEIRQIYMFDLEEWTSNIMEDNQVLNFIRLVELREKVLKES
ncbi:DUF4288 domain-containing protein [Sphingobacterium sp. HJSM2_6]|uniref:DUF4288 domain-containing protein n=1 Tax=Sphingobacterium sp. HJSM2_6 TaxID=3366264 RepID=UPI003BC01CB6